jgi:hypothetical protein
MTTFADIWFRMFNTRLLFVWHTKQHSFQHKSHVYMVTAMFLIRSQNFSLGYNYSGFSWTNPTRWHPATSKGKTCPTAVPTLAKGVVITATYCSVINGNHEWRVYFHPCFWGKISSPSVKPYLLSSSARNFSFAALSELMLLSDL